MHGISTNVVELYVYYILIMYYYVGYCRTIIILLGELGARGGGWQGEGPEGEVAGCRLRGVSPRALAARLALRASPRSMRVSQGPSRLRVRLPLRLRLRLRFRLCVEMRFPERERERERERESLAFPGNVYQYLPHPSPRPPGRQDPDCRPVPTHVILTRTIPPDSEYRVILAIPEIPSKFLRFYCFRMYSLYIPRFPYILAVLYTFAFP